MDRLAERRDARDYGLVPDIPGKSRKGKLRKMLRRRGRGGWLLAPAVSTDTVLGFERDPEGSQVYEYRVLESGTPPGLERSLEEAVAAGYRFLRLLPSPTETFVVVGRPLEE
jgi:hypothetical protein